MELNGRVVVVTGAGSGIGRSLCQAVAEKGARVAACDINGTAAQETVDRLSGGAGHRAFQVDVADRTSVVALAGTVADTFGSVDVVVNNAGVLGQVAPLGELDWNELEWIVGIDLWGVIHGTKAFLPHLLARPEAALVNVSSLAGLMGSLGNAAYFAAKFGVRGFSEAVRAELQRTSVRVTIVFPGIVRTNLGASHPDYSEVERAEAIRRYNAQPGVTPQRAAAKIVRGIEKGMPRVLIGPDAWSVDKLVRLIPARSDRLLHPLVARMANKQRPDGREVFR